MLNFLIAQLYQINLKKKKLNYFIVKNDSPHYQLLSSDINHIKKYFPKSKIKFMIVKTIKIDYFLKKFFFKKKN